MVQRLAAIPLLAQPGAEWNYSNATDVLGHLVAVISGRGPFDEYPGAQKVIEPFAHDGYGHSMCQPRSMAGSPRITAVAPMAAWR